MNQRHLFIFPASTLALEEASTPAEAMEFLRSESMASSEIGGNIRYRLRLQKEKYAYLRCCWTGCRSSFHYRLGEGSQWTLARA